MAGPVSGVRAGGDVHRTRGPGGGGDPVPVTVDDAASALLRFASGALGTLEVARAAVRRPCDFTVEVNGSRGTLIFDYTRLNELWYGGADDDVRPVRDAADPRRASHAPVRGPVVADRPGCRVRLVVCQPGRGPAGGLAWMPRTPASPRARRCSGVRGDGDLGRFRPLGEGERGAGQRAVTWVGGGARVDRSGFMSASRHELVAGGAAGGPGPCSAPRATSSSWNAAATSRRPVRARGGARLPRRGTRAAQGVPARGRGGDGRAHLLRAPGEAARRRPRGRPGGDEPAGGPYRPRSGRRG